MTQAITEQKSTTMDEFRKEVARITQEELLKEPRYYSWICWCTGLKKAQDMQSLFFLSLYFVTGFVLWNWNAILEDSSSFPPLYMAVFFCNVYMSFVGAGITHNTIHTSMFRSSFKNRIVQILLSLTYGHPVSTYVPGHNLSHHKYTQTTRDIMNTYIVTSKYHALNFLFFQQQVVVNAVSSDIRYVLFQKEMGRFHYVLQVLKEFLVLLSVQIVLICIDPWKFFMFFYVPHLFGQWAIVTINLLQHDGCDEFVRGEENVNFNTARNFKDPWMNFVLMNNGYHTIHHLVPTSHWSINPILHEKLIVGNIDPRLDWNSKFAYIVSAYFLNSNPWNTDPVRRSYDGKVIDLSKGKVSESNISAPGYKYEEWMTLPPDWDPSTIPTGKVALLGTFFLLVFKYALSPLYCFDPNIKLL